MLDGFSDLKPVRDTFVEASEALGIDFWASMADAGAINRTEITQPLMLAADVALWRAWQAAGGAVPALLAGHSLGEYAALVAAGALDLTTASKLVRTRAECMNRAPAGAMAAILGLEAEVVLRLCGDLAHGDVLEAVNFNAPGQIVIAGDKDAIARALTAAKDYGAKRAVELPVSVASHCSLMGEAARDFAAELAPVKFAEPAIPVLHNVDAKSHGAAKIGAVLSEQLDHPVQWIAIVDACVKAGVDTFYECGPGKVLVGLGKRIAAQARWVALGERAGFMQALAAQAIHA